MKFFYRRRFMFLTFVLCIAGTLYYMTYTLNSISSFEGDLDFENEEVLSLKNKIESLEHKAKLNEKNLHELEKIYQNIKSSGELDGLNNNKNLVQQSNYYEKQCNWFKGLKQKNSDFQVSELIASLPFDDIDGGVWKQGFDITYDPNQWNTDKKLNVIVVPHSHNDPGWIMTFEEYFEKRTNNILDTIVNSLSEKPTRRFIWAEISYLSLWWSRASEEMRMKMKRLITETKQLEIVTGGWVMTDEANSHYYAIIEQMVEGHEWLKNNIDPTIRPSYGWSIDPFGYSPTMAYLLKQMGFDSMLIQRVHYHLKKYLAQNQRFEFKWKQSWSNTNSKDSSIFCHVMPFYSYDIPHTCGPDPKICCQFDFLRARGQYSCPWGVQPQIINARNVDERARLLLDQYRKKSQLYGDKNNHNVLLVVLGDDFRYQSMEEATIQFENYEKIMDYLNSKSEFNVNIKFGTLKEYFEILVQNDEKFNVKTPSFSGDFFTYADRQDHYWSGYFTSRPFSKRLDRLVEAYLRSAEISFSLNNLLGDSNQIANELYKKLIVARQNLGIFQHHDGITGTSKPYVVLDYVNKLYLALKNSKEVIEYSTGKLISQSDSNEAIFNIDDVQLTNPNDLTTVSEHIIKLSKENPKKKIVLFNSNANRRVEVISLRINEPNVEILASDGTKVKNIQLNLVWPNTDGGRLNDISANKLPTPDDLSFSLDFDRSVYELLFMVDIDPLSMTSFTIVKRADSEPVIDNFPKVTFFSKNGQNFQTQKELIKNLNVKIDFEEINSNTEEIKIHAGLNSEAIFSSKTGFLQKIDANQNQLKTSIKLLKYGTTSAREKSGAYLFLPDGPAVEIDSYGLQWIRVEQDGLLRNRVCVNMTIVLHCVEFYPELSDFKELKIPFFNIWNVVDLRKTHNYELAMDIQTDIQNKDEIYTDLNGFQFTKRKRYDKLTIQGNVYPMPSGAFIQDSNFRLNLISAQPLGVGTLSSGTIQVFLDRKLDQDDNRGMEQAMNDNVVVSNRFSVFYEKINTLSSSALDYPSVVFSLMSHDLLNPVIKLISSTDSIREKRNFVSHSVPCDLRLVNLRTMESSGQEPKKNEAGLILHRVPFEDCSTGSSIELSKFYQNWCDRLGDTKFQDLFTGFTSAKNFDLKQSLLTLRDNIDNQEIIRKGDSIFKYLEPMQIEAFLIKFN